jgi:hypothetical protein
MYNCIRLRLKWYYAADRCRLYAIEFKFLYPRIFLISDGRVLLEQHTVKRHINSPYLRFLADIVPGILRSVSVGKTYRHLRLGGIASGACGIGQQNDIFVAEHRHVCYCVVIQPYHNFTKCSSLPCFFMSFTTSRVLT